MGGVANTDDSPYRTSGRLGLTCQCSPQAGRVESVEWMIVHDSRRYLQVKLDELRARGNADFEVQKRPDRLEPSTLRGARCRPARRRRRWRQMTRAGTAQAATFAG